MSSAKLWLRGECFEFGVLHPNASDRRKVTLGRLSVLCGRIVSEVGSVSAGAGSGAQPFLRYKEWEAMAAEELGWTAVEAQACFDLCQLFLNNDRRSKSSSSAAADGSSSATSPSPDTVPTLPFCLFLFVQMYSHPKAVSVTRQTADTSWPEGPVASPSRSALRSPVRSPTVRSPQSGGSPTQSPRSLGLVMRATEQAHQLQFVKRSLPEILPLVFGCGAASQLSRAQFNALGFLILGGTSETSQANRLSDLYPGFADGDESATLSALTAWIVSHLGVNEVAYPPSGARSSSGSAQLTMSSRSRGTERPVTTPIIVSNVHKSTVFKTSVGGVGLVPPGGGGGAVTGKGKDSSSGASATTSLASLPDARIEQCHDAYVYILCPVRCVSIIGSQHCTVFVGAAAGVVSVEVCASVRVIAATAQIRIHNSVDSLLQLYTFRSPIVMGDCRGLTFSPHCAQYVGMRSHVAAVGLPVDAGEEQAWDKPHYLNSSRVTDSSSGGGAGSGGEAAGGAEEDTAHKSHSLLPPTKFSTLIVPLPTPAAAHTKADSMLPLPKTFRDALTSKRDKVRALRTSIKDAGLGDRARGELQAAVQAHFREWLLSSGHIRQVADLIRLHREEVKDPASPLSASAGEGSVSSAAPPS